MVTFKTFTLWTRHAVLVTLLAMVGSLYIVASAKSAVPEKAKTASVKKKSPAKTKTSAKKTKTSAKKVTKKTQPVAMKAAAPAATPKVEEAKAETTSEAPKTEEAAAEAPKEEAKGENVIPISDANHLKKVLKENGVDINQAMAKDGDVPRTYVANFPQDMRKIKDYKTKKDLFISTLLPMILKENEVILKERKHLQELKQAKASGRSLKHYESFWLNKMCAKYKVKSQDLDELLRRADIIPPSLALGQAVIESGTGTSYAALNKHSPFGMTVSKSVLKYKDLSDSVRAYIHNLNCHAAYRTMRKTREKLRKENKQVDGNTLIGDMVAYCEFKNYIPKVRSAIKQNNLLKYDNLDLKPKDTA